MSQSADLVLRHGKIYTMDKARSWTEAIAISNGKIVFVGSNFDVDSWIDKKTIVLDLEQKLVLPSFIDSHVHPIMAGLSLSSCELSEKLSKEQILESVYQYAQSKPKDKWIIGSGWNLWIFPDANPQKEWLDAIVPDVPVFILSADYHSAWVNSKALVLAGITQKTRNPKNGRIERNALGEPSGTLRETAVELVRQLVPPADMKEKLVGLKKALKIMNQFGITGFQDAWLTLDSHAPDYLVYNQAQNQGLLTARVNGAMYADPEASIPKQLATFKKIHEQYRGVYFHPGTVKFFLDGVIEANTAALLEPYADELQGTGNLVWEPTRLLKFIKAVDQEGFQIHFHVIGDRAVRVGLDAVEALFSHISRDRRPLFAHLELIAPEDILRFAKVPIVPIFQPFWTLEDSFLTIPKLGPTRAYRLYPIKSVADTGAVIAMGSDWHVSSLNPLDAIQMAVTRQNPEECIDLHTALLAYTMGSAYANFWDMKTGSLEVGKSADLVVLSENLFAIPVTEISKSRVMLTLFEGKEVYREKGF